MSATFLSGDLASRRSRRGPRYFYLAFTTLALLAFLAVGAFAWPGQSSAARAAVPSVAIPDGLFASSCPSPSFEPVKNFPAGIEPVSVAVGDFNRDGNPDVATANQESDN